MIRQKALEDRAEHLGAVDEQELVALYKNAGWIVVPSLYEGFGLPALEAATFKKAVLCSDIEAMREVLGDAGFYVGSENVEEWAEAMVRLGADDEMRHRYAAACKEQAENFSVEKFARNTINVLVRECKK